MCQIHSTWHKKPCHRFKEMCQKRFVSWRLYNLLSEDSRNSVSCITPYGMVQKTLFLRPDFVNAPPKTTQLFGVINWFSICAMWWRRKLMKSGYGVCFGSGLSCYFKANKNYGIRFFLDYNLQPSHNKASGEWINTLACGASFALLL